MDFEQKFFNDLTEWMKKIDERLERIEAWRNRTLGYAAAIAVVISIAMAFVSPIIEKIVKIV